MKTEVLPAHASTPPAAAGAGGKPRLWPAVVLISLFWIAFVVVGRLEKPYFVGFMYSMAAPAVLLLLFSIWWWFNRRIPWADRVYGCLVVVALGVLGGLVCGFRVVRIGILDGLRSTE